MCLSLGAEQLTNQPKRPLRRSFLTYSGVSRRPPAQRPIVALPRPSVRAFVASAPSLSFSGTIHPLRPKTVTCKQTLFLLMVPPSSHPPIPFSHISYYFYPSSADIICELSPSPPTTLSFPLESAGGSVGRHESSSMNERRARHSSSVRPFSRIPLFLGGAKRRENSHPATATPQGKYSPPRRSSGRLATGHLMPFPEVNVRLLLCCPVYVESLAIFPRTVGVSLIQEHPKFWNNVHSWAQARSHSEGVSIFHLPSMLHFDIQASPATSKRHAIRARSYDEAGFHDEGRGPGRAHHNYTAYGLNKQGHIRCERILGTAYRRSPGLVNFVDALAYHFCLAMPAAFTQLGNHLLAEPCTARVGCEAFHRIMKPSPNIFTYRGHTYCRTRAFPQYLTTTGSDSGCTYREVINRRLGRKSSSY